MNLHVDLLGELATSNSGTVGREQKLGASSCVLVTYITAAPFHLCKQGEAWGGRGVGIFQRRSAYAASSSSVLLLLLRGCLLGKSALIKSG